MTARLPRFFTLGLCVLMGGLFVAAFLLNRNNYHSSINTVDTSFIKLLEQEAENLRVEIVKQENKLFELLERSDSFVPSAKGPALFVVLDDHVVPAWTTGLLETISARRAEEALKKGIAALPGQSAISHFRIAAKRNVGNSEDLYRKTAAFFNILELEHNIQTVCCILTLLEQSEPGMKTSQRQFFRSMLEEQVPELSMIEIQLARLWETANVIDQNLVRQRGAYRTTLDGRTLSIHKDGLALLHSPDVEAAAPAILEHSTPNGLHEKIIPGLYISISNEVVETAKTRIIKQYRTGNALLLIMLILGTFLTIGLFAAAKRQRELDVMRTNFIATVSHELRTPLSLIRLHAETLKHGRIPESKVDGYHQTILTEAERLSGIVNNVLDFSRMERNQLQINPEPTNLSALCEHIADSFKGRLQQDSFELERRIGPNIDATVDPLAFSQIVFNLLDNAIKYSDGEKSVRIELERSGSWIILRVADRGIGIPDKLKKHIFDDFVRSNDPKVTARRGSGIGLSVARRLTEEMAGSIEVQDNEPSGSIFTVTLKDYNETTGS